MANTDHDPDGDYDVPDMEPWMYDYEE